MERDRMHGDNGGECGGRKTEYKQLRPLREIADALMQLKKGRRMTVYACGCTQLDPYTHKCPVHNSGIVGRYLICKEKNCDTIVFAPPERPIAYCEIHGSKDAKRKRMAQYNKRKSRDIMSNRGILPKTRGHKTYSEIAKLWGISTERVRQLEARALCKFQTKFKKMFPETYSSLPWGSKTIQKLLSDAYQLMNLDYSSQEAMDFIVLLTLLKQYGEQYIIDFPGHRMEDRIELCRSAPDIESAKQIMQRLSEAGIARWNEMRIERIDVLISSLLHDIAGDPGDPIKQPLLSLEISPTAC